MFGLMGKQGLAEWIEEVFESVGLDDIDRLKLLAELAVRETPLLEPDDVGFGQIDEQAALIFSERHACFGQFEQKFWIGGQVFHGT